MQNKTIDEVLDMHSPDLMSIPGVKGTAMGLCKEMPCIHVFIERNTDQIRGLLPCELDGYKVRAVVSGEIFALD